MLTPELCEEAYQAINNLLASGYEVSGQGAVCKRCGAYSPATADRSAIVVKHEEECAAGKAIKVMRKIEAER